MTKNHTRNMPINRSVSCHSQQGFTLIEIIVGIVVLAVALALITSIIVPAARQSVSPIYQVRAAELAQAVMNEIMAKSFDQQNDRQGVRRRCEPDLNTCSPIPSSPFTQGIVRGDRIAVEQYNGFTDIENALGQALASRYPEFSLVVDVCYAYDTGVCAMNIQTSYKRVLVTVVTPDQQRFQFSTLRGNF